MKKYIVCFVLSLSLSSHNVMAQKTATKKVVAAKKTAVTAKKGTVEENKESALQKERIHRMRESTQKIVFVDSVVVSKADFLSKFNFNNEAGTIVSYNKFFKTDSVGDGVLYVNEMGNRCYFSPSSSDGHLYTSDMLGGVWTKPSVLKGLFDSESDVKVNYPFMMGDGTTLYFAATGQESIGGYDIFVTRYDSDTRSYLKPENIGMPFNSTANDYMYAIDEIDSLGWFVSDRNQTEGNVCIYTFVPSDVRTTYVDDNLTPDALNRLADIHSIAETWGGKGVREAALRRIETLKKRPHGNISNSIDFVVNDNVVYTDVTEFHSPENINNYNTLVTMKTQLENMEKAISNARNFYATANTSDRNELKGEMLKIESDISSLQQKIHALEKQLRNSENMLIKKQK